MKNAQGARPDAQRMSRRKIHAWSQQNGRKDGSQAVHTHSIPCLPLSRATMAWASPGAIGATSGRDRLVPQPGVALGPRTISSNRMASLLDPKNATSPRWLGRGRAPAVLFEEEAS